MSDTANVTKATSAANDANAAEALVSPDPVKVRADVIASNTPVTADVPSAVAETAPVVVGSVGLLLRERREKLSLTAGDIATKLRMGLKQVTALENADYASLPTGTFLRGFVRNYAKAVSLDPDQALAQLEKNNSAAVAIKASPVVVPSQQNIKVPTPGGELATPNGRAIVVGFVAMLLLAAVWYWWVYVYPYRGEGGREKAVATQSIAVPQPAVATEADPLPVLAANIDRPQPAPPVAAEIASPSPAPVAEKPAVAVRPTVIPKGSSALGFTFAGDSWVEVIDGGGKTVISRRFAAGDTEELIGRAPFSVVIGNANSTRMAFNGQVFDLEPYTRGAVARMTVK